MATLRLPRLPASAIEESALARGFVWFGFAVAAISVMVYGQAYIVPPLAIVGAAVGHRVSHRRRNLPRGIIRQLAIAGLVICSLGYFLGDSVGAVFGGQLPQANFAMLLLAVTSFDLKTRRNLYSSLFISLAVLYLAAVYAWDYVFGGLIGLWAIGLAGFWAASHIRRIGASFTVPRRPAAIALAGGLLGGLGCFALIPQPTTNPPGPLIVSLPSAASFKGELESPALPLVQFSGDPSGANSTVDLRYRGRLGKDVVMYVRTGAPAYWRGLVFDSYRNGTWYASHSEMTQFPAYVDSRHLPQPSGSQQGTFVQTFRVLRPLPGIIYAADPVSSIYFPAASIRRDYYGAWRAPEPLRPGQTYSVVSYLPDLRPAILQDSRGADDPSLGADTNPGSLSPRAAALARDVTKDQPTRYDQVIALTTYLQSHYRYSLELGHAPGNQDPVDWFLFDARIGYCEQFATAETLMLRSQGIPARLATGYSTGDYDPVLDQATVRERDAHAWVEVYFPGHGWVPVDPSPGFPTLAAGKFPDRWAASGIARLIPRLTLGGAVGLAGSLGAALLVPGVVALVASLVLGAIWLRRRLPARARPGAGEGDLLRLYARLQRRLGRRRGPPETPREYALAQGSTALGPLLADVTEAVNQAAYAGRPADSERIAAWREQVT